MIEPIPYSNKHNLEYLRVGYRFPAPLEDRWRAAATGILDDEQLHAMVLMDGRVEAGRLSNAVRMVMDSFPILGCRFRPSFGVWERRSDLDNISMWMVQVESRRFNLDTRPGVYRYIASARSPVENLVFEARLYRCSTDMLVVKTHHAITDSTGLRTILYAIADTYTKLEKDPAYQPPIQVFERDILQFLAKLPSQPLKHACMPEVGPNWTLPSSSPLHMTKPTICIHKVPASIWQAVKEFMQERLIPLDEVFLAAYYLALDEILTPNLPDELPVILHRDVRDLFTNDLNKHVANLSADFLVKIRMERGNSITDLLPRIRESLHKTSIIHMSNRYATTEDEPPDFNTMSQTIKQHRKRELEKLAAIPTLAVLGDLDPLCMNFGGMRVQDAYLLNPVSYAPRFEVSLSSFEDSLTISARYCEDAIDTGLVESLLRSMVTWLSVF